MKSHYGHLVPGHLGFECGSLVERLEHGRLEPGFIERNRTTEWGEGPSALPSGWMRRSLCSDPQYRNLDFTDHPGFAERQVCRQCPVVNQCLQYALDEKVPNGLWGGLLYAERQRALPIYLKFKAVA